MTLAENSTLGEQIGASSSISSCKTEFLSSNATLGLGDGDDRVYPEHVIIKSKKEPEELENAPLMQRFGTIHVAQVQMSRLHTGL